MARRTPDQTHALWRRLDAQGHDLDSAAAVLGITRNRLVRIITAAQQPVQLGREGRDEQVVRFDFCTLDEGEEPSD
jgi:hypothetical protein